MKGLTVSEITDREFEVECPWASEHTTGETTASILLADEDEEAFPAFHCFHDHCKNRRLKDVLSLFGVEDVDRNCGKKYGHDESVNVISGDDPYEVARLFMKTQFTKDEDRTLVHHQGEWLSGTVRVSSRSPKTISRQQHGLGLPSVRSTAKPRKRSRAN